MEERIDVPVEELAEDIRLNVVDVEDFNTRVVGAYNDGSDRATADKVVELAWRTRLILSRNDLCHACRWTRWVC